MSCIAGELRAEGGGDPRALMERMLAPMRPRAPHGDAFVFDGPAALAQAFLQTGSSPAESPHRLTLDGSVYLVADARIDGRPELVAKLRHAGCEVPDDPPHGELILHAWHAFGDALVDHLLGDFAFALWDTRTRRLFCARDHFGVRPFYYARLARRVVFASDIAALRADPAVPTELDEDAVGDFLMFGGPSQAEQTIFRHIRCLAPATCLDIRGDRVELRRYWELKPRPRLRLASRMEYVEGFREVFRRAVADRVPHGAAGVQLSGGMDSTAIAAMAVAVPGARLVACHESSRSVEPRDDEAHYARLVADRLRLPMKVHDIGRYEPFGRLDDPRLRTSLPLCAPFLAAHLDLLDDMTAAGAHVMLSGYSGDAALAHDPRHFAHLLREGRWRDFLADAAEHVRATGSLRGMGLRKLLQRHRPPPWKPGLPGWFDERFSKAHGLQRRWEDWWRRYETAEGALAMLSLPWNHRMFESNEALPLPIVFRYPFHDTRLTDYLLAMPSHLLQGKALMRDAMRPHLPPEVLARPKTGIAGDLIRTAAAGGKFASWPHQKVAVPGVDADALARAWESYRMGAGSQSTWASWLILHPAALGVWLSQQEFRDG